VSGDGDDVETEVHELLQYTVEFCLIGDVSIEFGPAGVMSEGQTCKNAVKAFAEFLREDDGAADVRHTFQRDGKFAGCQHTCGIPPG